MEGAVPSKQVRRLLASNPVLHDRNIPEEVHQQEEVEPHGYIYMDEDPLLNDAKMAPRGRLDYVVVKLRKANLSTLVNLFGSTFAQEQ